MWHRYYYSIKDHTSQSPELEGLIALCLLERRARRRGKKRERDTVRSS